jgi:hypothetical protein
MAQTSSDRRLLEVISILIRKHAAKTPLQDYNAFEVSLAKFFLESLNLRATDARSIV